jgi:hypothetical protein
MSKSKKKEEFVSNGDTTTPKHIVTYLSKNYAKLPDYIPQKNILRFDSNFECGNLDSAYYAAENEYNLLIKVDTNTFGNTYWFMYKVSNIKVNQEVRFNVLNYTRSMKKFYSNKMNVLTKAEDGEWRYGKCVKITYDES